MIVVGLSGKAMSGKTTFANMVLDYLKSARTDRNFEIIPLAKRLKEQARYLGWNEKKDEKGRQLLQELSKPIKNYHGKECYAKWCLTDAIEKDLDVLLIDDVRMMAEVQYIFEGEGLKSDEFKYVCPLLLRINRPDVDEISTLTESQKQDVSETELDDYPFSKIIDNSGDLDFLRDQANQLGSKIVEFLPIK